MNAESRRVQLIEVPVLGKAGGIWHRLHDEREKICAMIIKESQSSKDGEFNGVGGPKRFRHLLQARLSGIDDALDRLMSGAYGNCSKCGQAIQDEKLELDPAVAVCFACYHAEQTGRLNSSEHGYTNHSVDPTFFGLSLETLKRLDTVLVQTVNSDYRIQLLDEKGRALVTGGKYLAKPKEVTIIGSSLRGRGFKMGSIALGYQLEMWVDGTVMITSPIKSVRVSPVNPEGAFQEANVQHSLLRNTDFSGAVRSHA